MPAHNLSLSLQDYYLKVHLYGILLSYAIFFVASLASLFFLIQNSALKNKRAGVILNRLPGLSFLDKLNYRAISMGFPILTVSIICGFIWSNNIQGSYWGNYNFRHIASLILWLIYAVTLHVRLSEKMRGRKIALLSLFAFFVIILSMLGNCL